MEKKTLGELRLSRGPVLLWPMSKQCMIMIQAALQVRSQIGRVDEAFTGLMRLALQDASWLGPGADPPSDLDTAGVHLTSGNGESG